MVLIGSSQRQAIRLPWNSMGDPDVVTSPAQAAAARLPSRSRLNPLFKEVLRSPGKFSDRQTGKRVEISARVCIVPQ
nr:hypothetical protein CFP56_07535 [Quercus suber]